MPTPTVEERVRKRLKHYFIPFYVGRAIMAMGALLFIAEEMNQVYPAVLLFLGLIGGGLALTRYNKRPKRRSMVLWIRRFHRGDQSCVEQRFLQRAVYPWGTLVTLADSTIDSSSGYRKSIWGLGIVFIAMVAAGALGVFSGTGYWGNVVSIAFFAWAYICVGRVELKSDDWAHKLGDVSRILRRSVENGEVGFDGSVLNCPPDTDRWREVIHTLATVADAVVISVPESTSHVEWELAVLTASLGAGKIILATSGGSAPAIAMGALKVIQIPEPASSWHNRYARHRRRAWRSSMETILRAIESEPPDNWSPMTRRLEAWSSGDDSRP